MRLYHMIRADFGLLALCQRRLRASRLTELNDPFELIGVDISNADLRQAMYRYRDELSRTKGIHCFSRHWSNPVLWSHYADRHRGICLGFDVDERLTKAVRYETRRLHPGILMTGMKAEKLAVMEQILSTKFAHWKYEDEVRVFVELRDPDPVTGFYYTEFSCQLTLKEVIVGSECDLTRAALIDAIGAQSSDIVMFKARPAFKTFKVVRNRNERLWT